MKSIGELKAYFKQVAADLGLTFEYGSTERILNRQSSNLIYPLLWLEAPDMEIFRSGGLKKRFSTAFVILSNVNPDDYEGQDNIVDICANLVIQVLQRMQKDADENRLFEFDMGRTFSQQKQWWSADNDWGWRTEFDLVVGQCEKIDCCPLPTTENFYLLEDGSGFYELEDSTDLYIQET